MGDQQTSRKLLHNIQRIPRLEFARFLLAALASMLAAWGLLIAGVHVFMTWGEVNANIPLDRARVELADRLGDTYRVELDPDARVVAAHEQYGSLRGGGVKWFQVRLAKRRGRSFEAEFLTAARAKPEAHQPAPMFAEAIGKEVYESLDWPLKPTRRVHAWRLDNRTSTYALFFGDEFYYHWGS